LRPDPVPFRRRSAVRWSADASLGPTTPDTAKSGQLDRDLTEQRRNRMVPVILHAANTTAARAIWPPDYVIPRLRGRDLPLDICQHQLRLGQGQPRIGNVAKTIRPPDLHAVRALGLTIDAGFRQPQNPCDAPTPRSKNRRENTPPSAPSFAAVPQRSGRDGTRGCDGNATVARIIQGPASGIGTKAVTFDSNPTKDAL
jgi:hypothetical protein